MKKPRIQEHENAASMEGKYKGEDANILRRTNLSDLSHYWYHLFLCELFIV
jgi:hypothetical protein